jgi:ribosomal protein S18 acetylase RimI-like enzyme
MHVRRYETADEAAVRALAPRLTEGVAPWRDPAEVRRAVEGWVHDSLARAGDDDHAVLVATDDDEVVGFATVGEQAHWAGGTDAYIGELAVAAEAEGRGVGRRLVREAERWAAGRGLARITLETGAANEQARRFYAALGYAEEQVQLTRPSLST